MNKFQIRKIIQLVFLGLSLLLLLFLIPHQNGSCHQFCPYSQICFGRLTLSGVFIYLPAVILGLLIAISTIFIGRIFCGYLCFLGTIQEYIFRLNHQKKKKRMPPKIHRFLGMFKYLIFLITLILAILNLQYLYFDFCPIVSLSTLSAITIWGIITLGLIFILGFFIERFWCRYLCPYAALMNIFQFMGKKLKIKRHVIKRNMEVCVDCYLCTKNCSMNIDLTQYEEVTDPNCIYCLQCVKKCPKKGCLTC
ncbi:MAG TPA: 4Fe-4S binding protein [Candidatus Cloacimonadota bacterium]|nr:4Fe-4S binding protein [Candidatus Cloacimonadota bacterium]